MHPRKNSILKDIVNNISQHLGHSLQIGWGVNAHRGKLLRIHIDEELETIVLFVDVGGTFPEKIYFDQVHRCSCQGYDGPIP